ncbi:MAG: ABC transporter ATP-binding protein [Nitrospira sp.]|nr:ABC transporter ATP-binding protein [Nitrospira sp.]
MRESIKVLFDRQQRKQAVMLMVFSLVLACIEALGVGSVVPFVTMLQAPESLEGTRLWNILVMVFGQKNPHSMVVSLGGALLVVFVLKNALTGIQFRLNYGFVHEFFRRLSSRLLASYMAQPFVFFLGANCAILSKNVMTETYYVAEQIVAPALMLFSEVLVLLAVIGVLFLYEPVLSLVALGAIGAVLGGIYYFSGQVSRRLGRTRESTSSQMAKVCHESLSGIKDIKVSGTEAYFVGIYDALAAVQTRATALHLTLEQVPKLVIETGVAGTLIALILYFKGSGTDASGATATLAMYLVAAYRLMPSVNRINTSIIRLRYLEAGYAAFAPVLIEALHRNAFEQAPVAPLLLEKELVLADVRFRYPGGEVPVLDGIALHVHKGEVVGFVGASGAGKSTLINVILGLLKPDEGQLCVDGRSLTDREIRSWQAAVAYVPQHVFIADDTLAHNVALGTPHEQIDWQRLRHVLDVVQLSDLIKELPEGVSSPVGERGARVSGGQIQRLGIARALYRNRPILVLDEATSALDVETEERIIRALHEDAKDQTILIIAHRYLSLRNCDRIYRLENGRVTAAMTYEELQRSVENISS